MINGGWEVDRVRSSLRNFAADALAVLAFLAVLAVLWLL